jgi:hypothetical protein
MVAPVFGDPTRRYVVADDGSRFLVAGFRWRPPIGLDRAARAIDHSDTHPAIARARRAEPMRRFLQWSRFPFFRVEDQGTAFLVIADDARYAPVEGNSWAATGVSVPKDAAGHAGVVGPVRLIQDGRRPLVPRIVAAIAFWCEGARL